MTGNTRNTRPSPVPATVLAWVSSYFDDRGYGFAEIISVLSGELAPGSPTTVFFRKEKARAVEGTADEPVLTDQATEAYISTRGRRATRLVMRVVPGPKGLQAVAWGVIPMRDWRADLMKAGTLGMYRGGSVSIRTIRGSGGDLEGTLDAVEFTVEALTLHIREVRNTDRYGFSSPEMPGVQEFNFPSSDLRSRGFLPYGRFGFEVYGDRSDRLITLHLPDEA